MLCIFFQGHKIQNVLPRNREILYVSGCLRGDKAYASSLSEHPSSEAYEKNMGASVSKR